MQTIKVDVYEFRWLAATASRNASPAPSPQLLRQIFCPSLVDSPLFDATTLQNRTSKHLIHTSQQRRTETMHKQTITPFLWFDSQAEEAVKFYVSLFADSKIVRVTTNPNSNTAMVVEFELGGRPYIAMNGGPRFKLNESFSMVVNCESQAELDELWEKLSVGGEPSQCGWLKDRYGLSWQVVPSVLPELMNNSETAAKVMEALMQMTKLDIAKLQRAATVPHELNSLR